MTKLRAPLSFGGALARVAGIIPGDYAAMGRIAGCSAALVRAWGDPDKRERMPIEAALAFDLAYREAGGDGAPIFEAYGKRLDAAGLDWFGDQVALGKHAAQLIRECGEAEAAVVLAAQPGSTARDRANAVREIEEAMVVLLRARTMLAGTPAPWSAESDPPSTGPPV